MYRNCISLRAEDECESRSEVGPRCVNTVLENAERQVPRGSPVQSPVVPFGQTYKLTVEESFFDLTPAIVMPKCLTCIVWLSEQESILVQLLSIQTFVEVDLSP